AVLDGDPAIEVPVPRRPRGAANRLDLAAQYGAWDGDDGYLRGLTLGDVPAIELADPRRGLPTAQVRNLGHGFTGARDVTDLIGRQVHSPAQVTLVVLLQGDVAGGVGFDDHRGDVTAGGLAFDLGFAARGFVNRDAAAGGLLAVLNVLLDLVQLLDGSGEGKLILPHDDGGHQLVPPHLHLRNLQVGFGFDELEAHLLVPCFGFGRGLLDVLFRFGQIGFGLAELKFLLGGVETDHLIVLLYHLPAGAKKRDRDWLASGHGDLHHLRIAALQLAFGCDGERDVAPLHGDGRHVNRGRRSDSDRQTPGAEGGDAEQGEDEEITDHRFCSGSDRVTCEPSGTPLMATSSGLRASTSTGIGT